MSYLLSNNTQFPQSYSMAAYQPTEPQNMEYPSNGNTLEASPSNANKKRKTAWQRFLHEHRGMGKTSKQLARAYSRSPSPRRYRKRSPRRGHGNSTSPVEFNSNSVDQGEFNNFEGEPMMAGEFEFNSNKKNSYQKCMTGKKNTAANRAACSKQSNSKSPARRKSPAKKAKSKSPARRKSSPKRSAYGPKFSTSVYKHCLTRNKSKSFCNRVAYDAANPKKKRSPRRKSKSPKRKVGQFGPHGQIGTRKMYARQKRIKSAVARFSPSLQAEYKRQGLLKGSAARGKGTPLQRAYRSFVATHRAKGASLAQIGAMWRARRGPASSKKLYQY